ncbi:hypothetical protein AVO45_12240 [Ruegeria marisrubri]|uniref:Uncharacterized protein n=1 Tax=Ruegeria marisrubri TaxID=1685379 RepID=A0A0X3TLD4_9RHOB|nr:hypothetical protein [Ruegeria marisrubri]KUJ76548.1 hypothetical protein AVO45_12240 [Ruegeria marisrubri]
MLDILSKLIGSHRAVSVYAFFQTKGLVVLAVLGMLAIVAGLLFMGGDGEHKHEAFLTVPVLSETPINGDLNKGIIVSVRLPDGSATSITSTEGPVAKTVGTTACVEKRVYVDSGKPRYRLKLPKYCGVS